MTHSLPHSLRGLDVGIVGAGNMGQALIRGLLKVGILPGRLVIVEANASTRRRVSRVFRVGTASLDEAVTRCDVLLLAVKPQDLSPVLEQLRQRVTARSRRPLVISIAAGVRLRTLERRLGRAPVVRVMPNLPAKVGCGISAVTAGRLATAAHRKIAKAIFGCVGEVVELPERMFDVVTAISGSGPAYFFVIFKALRDAGARAGLPVKAAQQLAVQTALGSARLVDHAEVDLEGLIRQVASKRGTTEAALRVFHRRRVAQIIHAAVAAAARRSRALSTGR